MAEENYSLLDLCVSKPWTKIQGCCAGVTAAWLYFNILQYRKQPEFDQKMNYKFIHFLHQSWWASKMMYLVSLSIIGTCLFIGHPAISDPYLWDTLQN
jgi:hypothetical protein|tara:strand:+ start:1414 stop:1707 length:294 start_codon:yes stop_codon:yes gene_type:complete